MIRKNLLQDIYSGDLHREDVWSASEDTEDRLREEDRNLLQSPQLTAKEVKYAQKTSKNDIQMHLKKSFVIKTENKTSSKTLSQPQN